MRELVCIVCPNGCTLSVDEQTLAVTGNKCRKVLDLYNTADDKFSFNWPVSFTH